MTIHDCPLDHPVAWTKTTQKAEPLGRVRPHRARTDSRFSYSYHLTHQAADQPTLDSGVRR